jgi:hypothetical protein
MGGEGGILEKLLQAGFDAAGAEGRSSPPRTPRRTTIH